MKDRDFLKGKQDGKNEITNIVENHNKLKYLQQCREIDTEVRCMSIDLYPEKLMIINITIYWE